MKFFIIINIVIFIEKCFRTIFSIIMHILFIHIISFGNLLSLFFYFFMISTIFKFMIFSVKFGHFFSCAHTRLMIMKEGRLLWQGEWNAAAGTLEEFYISKIGNNQ